jgi:galactonate dehydratase
MKSEALSRRSFIGASIAAAGAGAVTSCSALPGPDGRPKARITGLEPIIIQVNELGTWDFVQLQTDVGVTGIGEPSHSGKYKEKIKALNDLFPLLEGLSPFDIELFRQRFMALGPHKDGPLTTAFSGIDHAMWDLAGKLSGLSVADLLGGPVHDKIRAYANINRATRGDDRTPEGFAANAKKALTWCFTAIKMAPFDDMPGDSRREADWKKTAEPGVARIKAVREAIGDDVDLLIDVHSKFGVEFGIEMAGRLEPYNLFWMEEPLRSYYPKQAGQVTKAVSVRTAGGEHLFGMQAFGDLLKHGGWDTFMPDVKHCGGIWEMRKIAAIGEAGGHTCAPHNPTGPVATAASVQCCATMPNFLILEYAWGEVPWSCDLIEPREEFIDGYLPVYNRPGLGIELNMKTVNAHRIKV